MKNSLKLALFALIMATSGLLVAMQRPLTFSEMQNNQQALQHHLDNLAWKLKYQSTDMAAMQEVYNTAKTIAQMTANFDLMMNRQAKRFAKQAEHRLYPGMQITGPGAGPARQLFAPTSATAATAATLTPAAPAPTTAPAPAAAMPPAMDMDID